MPRSIWFTAFLAVVVLGAVKLAQGQFNGSPVAFVYVTSRSATNSYQINAFSAAPNGKLTAVAGSPFAADVQSMAVNGKYLFGTNGVDIDSFLIGFDGGLQEVSSVNAQQYNGYNCGGPYALFLDHTGQTLYDEDVYGNICANNTYQSFGVDDSTGSLSYLGMTNAASAEFWMALSFVGNNVYAYGADCYQFYADIFGFVRNPDETLTQLKITPPIPMAQKGNGYCPYLASGDPENHLAISMQQISGATWEPVGPPQLATYTADSSGNLTTKSTYSNMAKTEVGQVTDLWMAPSGKLVAVGGMQGLQVFHFNGGHPVTHYSGLLTKDEITQFFWDNDQHLYAISQPSGKLYVFTVTPTQVWQAPGSPYTITNPQNIIVLPMR